MVEFEAHHLTIVNLDFCLGDVQNYERLNTIMK